MVGFLLGMSLCGSKSASAILFEGFDSPLDMSIDKGVWRKNITQLHAPRGKVKHVAPFWVCGSASFEINSFFVKAKHRIRKRSIQKPKRNQRRERIKPNPKVLAMQAKAKAQMESEGRKMIKGFVHICPSKMIDGELHLHQDSALGVEGCAYASA